MIFLDSNIAVAIIEMRNAKLRRLLGEELHAGTPIALPVIALQELRYGFARSGRRQLGEKYLEKFLSLGIAVPPFEAEDAAYAAEIRAALDVYRARINPYDALMAAQARRHGAALATLNKESFARVPELNVLDWSE